MKKGNKNMLYFGIGTAVLVVAGLIWYFTRKGKGEAAGTLLGGSGLGNPVTPEPDEINTDSVMLPDIEITPAAQRLSSEIVIPWQEWVDNVYSTRFAGRPASEVVQMHIEEVINTPSWLEGVAEATLYKGIPLEENIVWAAILSACSSNAICIASGIDFVPPLPIEDPQGYSVRYCATAPEVEETIPEDTIPAENF